MKTCKDLSLSFRFALMNHLTDTIRFSFLRNEDLTAKQKDEIFELHVEVYPSFKSYYEKNRYYSSIKPQILLTVYDGDHLAATGKLLWKNLVHETLGSINFFGFGFLIRAPYQNQGVGKKILQLYIHKTRELKGDLLYGTSNNPVITNGAFKYGFKRLTTHIVYTDTLTNAQSTVSQNNLQPFAYEFKSGLIDQINQLKEFNIGVGPV